MKKRTKEEESRKERSVLVLKEKLILFIPIKGRSERRKEGRKEGRKEEKREKRRKKRSVVISEDWYSMFLFMEDCI